MFFNKDIKKIKKETKKENTVVDHVKELSEEEVLNSNNIELIANYAKKKKSKIAIDKVRELLQVSRSLGEKIVNNIRLSFSEIDEKGSNRSFNKNREHYLNFKETNHGKLALEDIEKMPEPFKTKAKEMLLNYEKELKFNIKLFKEKKRDPKLIWEQIFGFKYLDEKDSLSINLSPLSFEFTVKDQNLFDKAYSKNLSNKPSNNVLGFSSPSQHSFLINDTRPFFINKKKVETTLHHERQHELYDFANPIDRKDFSIDLHKKFSSVSESLNNIVREMFEENLKHAKDEIFAIVKGEEGSKSREDFIFDIIFSRDGDFSNSTKEEKFNHMKKNYDYNEKLRRKILLNIDDNNSLSYEEKKKLKMLLIFFSQNMIGC